MTEAQWALVQMLDGVQRHDLPDQLGLPDDEIDRIWSAYESAQVALAQPAPPAEGEVGELVGRLGWIAAQLGDIGWHDDAADVACAAAIISQRHPAPVPVAERPPLPCELDGDGFCYLGVLETDPLLGEPRFSCWDYEESRKWLNGRFTHFLPWNTPSLPAHALPLPAEPGRGNEDLPPQAA